MSLNLLPWRQHQHSKHKKNIYKLSLLVVLLIIPIEYSLVNVFHKQLLKIKTECVKLEATRVIYEKKISREPICLHDNLVKKILKTMQDNHRSHVYYIQLLQGISHSMPNNCELTKLDIKKSDLTVTGLSYDNNHVNELVNNLEKSNLINQVKLAELKQLKTSPHIYFVVKAKLSRSGS